jgi:CheY-like chemotaxis protein
MKPIHALIIDDNVINARVVARTLRELGWTTTEAHDPIEAAPHYATADVVVTDWEMPNGGGERVLVECGKPVMILSGNQDVIEELRATKRPALLKPAQSEAIRMCALGLAIRDAGSDNVRVAYIVAAAHEALNPTIEAVLSANYERISNASLRATVADARRAIEGDAECTGCGSRYYSGEGHPRIALCINCVNEKRA